MKKTDNRNVLFALGDFVIQPDVADLLSYADVQSLIQRHARGDWGRVTAQRWKMNDAFIHPKSRTRNASAESVHVIKNATVGVRTKQREGRRTTLVFLL